MVILPHQVNPAGGGPQAGVIAHVSIFFAVCKITLTFSTVSDTLISKALIILRHVITLKVSIKLGIWFSSN